MATSNSTKKVVTLLTEREQAIIQEAARAAFAAGLAHATERSENAFKATERRLNNLPTLRAKVKDDRERVAELATHGSIERSTSLVRFRRSGSRVEPEDALDALIQDMAANIAATEYEIATMEKALALIAGDQHVQIIPCLYFDNLTVQETAKAVNCDRSTVFRYRARLIQSMAVFLYGVDA
jgi:DNA-directed RNA polymerase specialized sigma subunit